MIEKLLIGSVESDYSQCRVGVKFHSPSDDSSLSVFKAISSSEIIVDVINYTSFNSSEPTLFFTIKKSDVDTVVRAIKAHHNSLESIDVDVDLNIVIISVIGIGIRADGFVISEICRIFVNYKADIKSFSISEVRIEIMTTAGTMVSNILRDLESVFL